MRTIFVPHVCAFGGAELRCSRLTGAVVLAGDRPTEGRTAARGQSAPLTAAC